MSALNSRESWLHITAPAAAVGTVASVLTYTLLIHSSAVAASGTGLLVDSAGAIAAAGTRYFVGDVPAATVRVLGRVWSTASETAVRTGGSYTALAVAAAVGGTTALTVSLGSRIAEVTVEYGSSLSKTAATKIAEAYLRFKDSGIQPANAEYIITDSEEGEWILMDVSGQSLKIEEVDEDSGPQ
jgi:hypothetical protein